MERSNDCTIRQRYLQKSAENEIQKKQNFQDLWSKMFNETKKIERKVSSFLKCLFSPQEQWTCQKFVFFSLPKVYEKYFALSKISKNKIREKEKQIKTDVIRRNSNFDVKNF